MSGVLQEERGGTRLILSLPHETFNHRNKKKLPVFDFFNFRLVGKVFKKPVRGIFQCFFFCVFRVHAPEIIRTAFAFYHQVCHADVTLPACIQDLYYLDFQGAVFHFLYVDFKNPDNFPDLADLRVLTL